MKYFVKHFELLKFFRLISYKKTSTNILTPTQAIDISWKNGFIKRILCMTIAAGSVGLTFGLNNCLPTNFSLLKTCRLKEKQSSSSDGFQKPPTRADLPTFSMEEVRRHGKDAERIWVIFQQGVYDVTEFIANHPGGDRILLAAGASIEPFWAVYPQHKTDEVMEILEEMRIGSLKLEDLQEIENQQKDAPSDDPFTADPSRHPALIVNMQKPFNAETPPSLLVDSFLTPKELFFVRNHMFVPRTDEQTHKVRIDGIGVDKQIVLSLDQLRNNFEPVSIVSAIQCAGNRRSDMNQFKKVQGLMWTGTAISNARWKGCRLRDVLIASGIKPNDERIKHVHFEGADVDASGSRYGASIPFEKAMRPEVIIAYEMNGDVLTRDHGFPIRLVVPGHVGARQVKWLNAIRLSDEESPSTWQQKDYKAFPSSVQIGDPLPFDTTPAIQEYPVQSVICEPNSNTKIVPGAKTITVRGYAWSGGGRGIIRVEVSPDNGTTWKCAELEQCPEQNIEQMWAWTLWTVELPISEATIRNGRMELVCKATDRSYNTQPETGIALWNVRGLLHNAWHRVTVLCTLDHIPQIRHLQNVEYRHIRMADVESEELLASQKLQNALDYVEDSVNRGINIVVHCQCGISRSATVVMAYLMRKYKWSVNEAFSFVQARRSCVQPNPSFLRQLEVFQKLDYRCDLLTLHNSKLFKEFECISKSPSEVSRSTCDIYSLNESAKLSVGRRFSCKKCRCDLFYDFNILSHNFVVASGQNESVNNGVGKCGLNYLLTPMEWMELNEHSGKIVCFNCCEKIGHYNWSGMGCLFQCAGNNCGTYIAPWVHVHSAKIDSFEIAK
ncbi:hypothetical protein niasHT_007548 [Heterodera trifolii]|uniref:sulfite oxidase n=1 Tax=Heterodera trifolii TaxID=157864 RepID=A0ABD2LR63_9BILA